MISTDQASNIVALDKSDPMFTNTDGHVMWQRAAISVDKRCPSYLAGIVEHCIKMNWVKPIAYMRTTEYIAAKLERD